MCSQLHFQQSSTCCNNSFFTLVWRSLALTKRFIDVIDKEIPFTYLVFSIHRRMKETAIIFSYFIINKNRCKLLVPLLFRRPFFLLISTKISNKKKKRSSIKSSNEFNSHFHFSYFSSLFFC